MNQKLLTVLGCSGSMALTLINPTPAEANTTTEYVFTAPNVGNEVVEIPSSDKDYPFYDCTCSEYDAETIKKLDLEGEKAIDLYGCDCAGCRRLVQNIK